MRITEVNLSIVGLREGRDEPMRVGRHAWSHGLLPGGILLPHHHILYYTHRKEHWLLTHHPIWLLSHFTCRDFRSCPSKVIVPVHHHIIGILRVFWNESDYLIEEDGKLTLDGIIKPLKESKYCGLAPTTGPTNAMVLEEGITRFNNQRIKASGRDGYAKLTALNSILPRTVDIIRPHKSQVSISGTLSMIPNTRLAATVPCAN